MTINHNLTGSRSHLFTRPTTLQAGSPMARVALLSTAICTHTPPNKPLTAPILPLFVQSFDTGSYSGEQVLQCSVQRLRVLAGVDSAGVVHTVARCRCVRARTCLCCSSLSTEKPSWCTGYGTASRVADPKFRNARGGDVGLQPSSPAIGMGFVPLPPGLDRC